MRGSSDRKLSLPVIRFLPSNEDGAALIIGLMFLAILALVGTTAVVLTSTDLQIGGNYKAVVQAFSAAQAGTEEARGRLISTAANYVGDPATTPNPSWSVYIMSSGSFSPSSDDPDYNGAYTNNTAPSLQSDTPYLVKIRHKREYDAEQAGHTVGTPHYYDNDGNTSTNSEASPGSIVYYGYGDPTNPVKLCQFTGTGGESTPVEIITGYGKVSGSLKILEVEVRRPLPPPIKAALYGKDTTTINGGSGYISGADNCSAKPSLPPVYVYNSASPPYDSTNTNIIENPAPTYDGNPASAQEGPDDIDITGYVDSMKDSATEIITSDQNSGGYGSSTNYVTCYCNSTTFSPPGLDMRTLTGYGILLVEGDLTLSGGFTWYGLILCTGTLTLNGGGAGVNIYGASLANQTVDINGGLDIRYDSCEIANALGGQTLKIIRWSDTLD